MAKNLKSFLTKKYPSAFSTEILNEVEWLDTGLPTLNYVISGRPFSGGLPMSGKITCIYGPEGCGKTSFVNHMIYRAQLKNTEIVYLDTERSITKPRLEQFKINLDELIYSTPETAEECFSIIEDVYKERVANGQEKEPILIIWDSLAGTPTQDELDRTAFQVEIASQPKVFSRNLRRIRGKIQRMNASLLLVNQARANQDRYGDLFLMPGGYALYHNCDVILRANKLKPDESGMGMKISTPSKNRLFKPFQNTTIQFDYVSGFTPENVMDAFCEFLKNITILGQAGPYCYLTTEVLEIMERDNVDEKEATKLTKKFFKKDFVERLMNDEEYYNKILQDSEIYVNQNITKVAKLMLDDEIDLDAVTADESGIKVSKKKLKKYIDEEDLVGEDE